MQSTRFYLHWRAGHFGGNDDGLRRSFTSVAQRDAARKRTRVAVYWPPISRRTWPVLCAVGWPLSSKLEALLESNDIGVTGAGAKKNRFLRKIYYDPITNQSNWGLIMGPDKRVQGIYSLSEEKPFKTTGFMYADADLELAEKYIDWQFKYVPKEKAKAKAKAKQRQ